MCSFVLLVFFRCFGGWTQHLNSWGGQGGNVFCFYFSCFDVVLQEVTATQQELSASGELIVSWVCPIQRSMSRVAQLLNFVDLGQRTTVEQPCISHMHTCICSTYITYIGGVPCAVRALCTRCAKSRPFSTTGRQFFGCRIAAGYYCHCVSV